MCVEPFSERVIGIRSSSGITQYLVNKAEVGFLQHIQASLRIRMKISLVVEWGAFPNQISPD